jgi:hypothetical protein
MSSIPLKGKVWLRRGALDRRLASGASPAETPELAARAEQVVSTRTRCGLATGLERVVAAADEPGGGLAAAAPLDRSQILASRVTLLELANDLRSPAAVRPRGVALIERLLTDGTSPLYHPSPDGSLDQAVRHARTALHLA